MGLAGAVLVAAVSYVWTSLGQLELEPAPPTAGCVAQTPRGSVELDVEQAANAATVGGVAFEHDLPREAVVIAYATVWQESTFYNIEFGDRDSLGLFQQRPSMDWGEPEDLVDPVYASDAFYTELAEVEDYLDLPVYEAAQEVQRSADGFAYDQHEDRSAVMAEAFTGAEGPAVSCWFDRDSEPVGQAEVVPGPEAAAAELERVFGVAPDAVPEIRADADEPQTGDLGWAMALWAVSHAQVYELERVSYGEMRWRADDAHAGWTEREDPLPEGELLLD
ncbi:hypothetical protein RIF23_17440 [Lipingzhangella sp. LS1_29]|uniref:Uncharacterized protein n=1 Tax=Lipingzhangella rawalii TaxID=2055835 RepID=A0ABU2H9W9_9ACTN|nr:hypothetical protein [Lipingzhangella rawalii]MDS1272076.1 hypothetical protein [Lipingzhangella rawalii]